MTALRVLASGVDSLYASVRGELWDGLLSVLHNMRELNSGEDVPFTFHGQPNDTMLRRHGWRGYPFWMTSPRWEIAVGAADPFPPLYLQLHAAYIHSLGVETAAHEAEEMLLRDFFPGGFRASASRVDVFADVQGWDLSSADFARFLCKGRRRQMFEVDRREHGFGRHLSGFTFGKGDVVARVYDKTREMTVSGQTWPQLLWTARDPELPVWRVEFQFRRAAIQEMGVSTLADAVRHRQGLWAYGTSWLTHRAPNKDRNHARWPLSATWADIAAITVGGCGVALIREHIRNADILRLTQGLVGYATALEAIDETEGLGGVLSAEVPAVRPYLAHRGTTFREIVAEKRRRRVEVAP